MIDENTYFDPYFPDEKFNIDFPNCECGKIQYSGLPCSHIMRWSLDHKINPMLNVSERYLQYEPSFTELNDYKIIKIFVFKCEKTNQKPENF